MRAVRVGVVALVVLTSSLVGLATPASAQDGIWGTDDRMLLPIPLGHPQDGSVMLSEFAGHDAQGNPIFYSTCSGLVYATGYQWEFTTAKHCVQLSTGVIPSANLRVTVGLNFPSAKQGPCTLTATSDRITGSRTDFIAPIPDVQRDGDWAALRVSACSNHGAYVWPIFQTDGQTLASNLWGVGYPGYVNYGTTYVAGIFQYQGYGQVRAGVYEKPGRIYSFIDLSPGQSGGNVFGWQGLCTAPGQYCSFGSDSGLSELGNVHQRWNMHKVCRLANFRDGTSTPCPAEPH